MTTQYRKSAVDEEMGGKRRASSDEWTANKKRALSSTSGSPIAMNGAMDGAYKIASRSNSPVDELEREDDLERFRKAAIFRRMRHYQRECGRAHERIQHLEDSLRLANLERIETDSCWSSTMETIRRLMQLDTIETEVGGNLETVFPSRIFSSEDFKKVRNLSEAKVQLAEKAISAFVKFAGKVERPKYEELFSEYQNLQHSNSFLTAEVEQTYILLEETQSERDRYLGELQIAQAKLDRSQSRVLNPKLEQDNEPGFTTKANGEVKADKDQGGAGVKVEDVPLAALASSSSANEFRYDERDWEVLLKIRDDRIMVLEKDLAAVRHNFDKATSELKLLGETTIGKTLTYRVLLEHTSKTEALLNKERQQLEKAREEISKLKRIQMTWWGQMEASQEKEDEELKLLLKKRDEDLNRIRQQREQLETQHKELKATYDSRRLSLAKYKELAESRGERIGLLLSEIRRLKTRLAAASGEEDLLKFLQNDANLDVDYINDVKKRLDISEKELNSLRTTIKNKDRHLISVASLQVKLDSAIRELDVFKNSAEGSLAKQLEVKNEEIRVLRLKEAQSSQEMTELFSEMDRLSKAWENADKQAHSQAMSVEKWEEEKEKLSVAKQKVDTRYYKAMSEFEAKDGERKQALRHAERQAKQIEAHEKSEKELLAVNDQLSTELSQAKSDLMKLQEDFDRETRSKEEFQRQSEEESRRIRLIRNQMKERENEIIELNVATVKLKDELYKKTKQAEKAVQKAQTMSMPVVPASEREDELRREAEKLMKVLKCSTCQHEFRSRIITKCMHTFCKSCVEARISHRQRKCPACNLTFSQSEVQTIYFQ